MGKVQIDEAKITDSGRRPSGDYAALQKVLDEAYRQSAEGKGNARHANDKPFTEQPILSIGRMVGPGFAAGQVMKKAQEAIGMAARGETEAAANELLGAIVYAASAVVLVREKGVALALAANADVIWGREAVAVEADASRLIEPEVAADVAPREFKICDEVRILTSDVPEWGTVLNVIGGYVRVRWRDASGNGGVRIFPKASLAHVDD